MKRFNILPSTLIFFHLFSRVGADSIPDHAFQLGPSLDDELCLTFPAEKVDGYFPAPTLTECNACNRNQYYTQLPEESYTSLDNPGWCLGGGKNDVYDKVKIVACKYRPTSDGAKKPSPNAMLIYDDRSEAFQQVVSRKNGMKAWTYKKNSDGVVLLDSKLMWKETKHKGNFLSSAEDVENMDDTEVDDDGLTEWDRYVITHSSNTQNFWYYNRYMYEDETC